MEHAHDERPADEDDDCGELIDLADTLQLANVKAVEAKELAPTAGRQPYPEGRPS